MKSLLVLCSAVLIGASTVADAKDPKPVFKSARNFYRAGDTAQVALTIPELELGICLSPGRSNYQYQLERKEGDKWLVEYNNSENCTSRFPASSTVNEGFVLKQYVAVPGIYRFRVSAFYFSNTFEVR